MSEAAGRLYKVVVFRSALEQGGADRVAIEFLNALDPQVYDKTLLVTRNLDKAGMAGLGADTRVRSLEATSLKASLLPMRRFFAEHKPDLLLSLDSSGNSLAVVARALGCRKSRLVVSERNILWNGGRTPKRVAEAVLKAVTYRFADRVTGVSEGVVADLHRLARVPRSRLSVMRSPVVPDDIELLAAEAAPLILDLPPATPLVVACGRLIPQKDHATLLRAVATLPSHHQPQVLILGEGQSRPELEALAAELGIADRVHLPGFVANPFPYMQRADVFVLPSRNEGMPGVLLQAMSLERATVATDCHSGPAEIIRHGENGMLVPVGDVRAMTGAISTYLDDSDLRERTGRAAKSTARPYRAKESITELMTALNLAPKSR